MQASKMSISSPEITKSRGRTTYRNFPTPEASDSRSQRLDPKTVLEVSDQGIPETERLENLKTPHQARASLKEPYIQCKRTRRTIRAEEAAFRWTRYRRGIACFPHNKLTFERIPVCPFIRRSNGSRVRHQTFSSRVDLIGVVPKQS